MNSPSEKLDCSLMRDDDLKSPSRMTIHVSEHQDTELIDQLRAGLTQHAEAVGYPFNKQHLSISARDDDGGLMGGLSGDSLFGWLFVNLLWVDESARGHGLGTQLLQTAEQVARERGCRGVYLNTIGFQAKDFYERLGYVVYGELEDDDPALIRFFMKRTITDTVG